ncbi:MAG: type II secretion system protein M [Burkholderiaceae bacterium]|nr:type II secretion system protein M [Burkholderiaceae bacterium]
MTTMIETLMQRWQLMAARERRLVVGAAAVLAVLAVWLSLVEPAWHGRAALRNELPTLRAQLAQVGELAEEARRLSSVPAGSESPQAQKTQLERSIDSAGLSSSLAQLSLNGTLFELRFDRVPHAAWLSWVDTATREMRLRVADVSVTREAEHGLVSVRLALETPRAEGR